MTNQELLDSILLADDVVERFYSEYTTNNDFQSWLTKVLPEIKDCYNNPQNHPRHKYDILGHILHSVENINALTKHLPEADRKMLSYTMLLHDIGKPATKRINDKTGYDCFYYHNEASEKVAIRALPELGFDSKDSAVIATLVNKHDMFINIKPFKSRNPYFRYLSPELIREEVDSLYKIGNGPLLLKYLVMVGKADNLAQNELETQESLIFLDTFDEMVDRETYIDPTKSYRGEYLDPAKNQKALEIKSAKPEDTKTPSAPEQPPQGK